MKREELSDVEIEEENKSLNEPGPSRLLAKDSNFGAVPAYLKKVSNEIKDPRFYSLTKQIDKRVVLGMGTPPQVLQRVPQINFFTLRAGMQFSFYVEHTKETSANLTLDNLGRWNKRGAPSVINHYFYDQKFRSVPKNQLYKYKILCYSSKNRSAEPVGSITRKIWKGFDDECKPIGTAIISYSVGHDFQKFHPEIQGNTRHSERSLHRRENPPVMRNVLIQSKSSQLGVRKSVPRLIDGPSLKTLPLGNGEAARKRKLDQMLSPTDVLAQLFKPTETTQTEKLFQGHTFADYSDEEPPNDFDEEEDDETLFEPKHEVLHGLDASDKVKMISSDNEMVQRSGKLDLVTIRSEKPSPSVAGSRDTRTFPTLMDSGIAQAATPGRLQFYCWLCPLTKAGRVGYDYKESLQMHFHRHHSKEEFRKGIDKLLGKPTTSRTTPARNKKTVRQASLPKIQPVERQAESSMKILKSSTFRSLPYQPQSPTNTLRNQLKFRLNKLSSKIYQTAIYLMSTDLNQATNYLSGLEMMANLDEGESSTFGGQFAKNGHLLGMGILGMKQDTSSDNDDRQDIFKSCSICLQALPDDLTVQVEWLRCDECHGWTHKSCREADLPCPSCLRGLLKAAIPNVDQNFVQVKNEIDD